MRMKDHMLKALVPLVAQAARDTPHPTYDDLLNHLLTHCRERGLRSIIHQTIRISQGEPIKPLPPLPPKTNYRKYTKPEPESTSLPQVFK